MHVYYSLQMEEEYNAVFILRCQRCCMKGAMPSGSWLHPCVIIGHIERGCHHLLPYQLSRGNLCKKKPSLIMKWKPAISENKPYTDHMTRNRTQKWNISNILHFTVYSKHWIHFYAKNSCQTSNLAVSGMKQKWHQYNLIWLLGNKCIIMYHNF